MVLCLLACSSSFSFSRIITILWEFVIFFFSVRCHFRMRFWLPLYSSTKLWIFTIVRHSISDLMVIAFLALFLDIYKCIIFFVRACGGHNWSCEIITRYRWGVSFWSLARVNNNNKKKAIFYPFNRNPATDSWPCNIRFLISIKKLFENPKW